jgi:hypothetical protein
MKMKRIIQSGFDWCRDTNQPPPLQLRVHPKDMKKWMRRKGVPNVWPAAWTDVVDGTTVPLVYDESVKRGTVHFVGP